MSIFEISWHFGVQNATYPYHFFREAISKIIKEKQYHECANSIRTKNQYEPFQFHQHIFSQNRILKKMKYYDISLFRTRPIGINISSSDFKNSRRKKMSWMCQNKLRLLKLISAFINFLISQILFLFEISCHFGVQNANYLYQSF